MKWKKCTLTREQNVDNGTAVNVSEVNRFQRSRSHSTQRRGQKDAIWGVLADRDTLTQPPHWRLKCDRINKYISEGLPLGFNVG